VLADSGAKLHLDRVFRAVAGARAYSHKRCQLARCDAASDGRRSSRVRVLTRASRSPPLEAK
jgi:hypothetical protein